MPLMARAGELAAQWDGLSPADRRAVLGIVVARIEVHPERLDVQLSPSGLADLLACDPSNLHALAQAGADPGGRLSLPIQAKLKRVGLGMKMVVAGARSSQPDPSLIKLFVKAILAGQHPSTLTAASLIKDTRLPLEWIAQRSALGFD
jgi:hypothetical protein